MGTQLAALVSASFSPTVPGTRKQKYKTRPTSQFCSVRVSRLFHLSVNANNAI